MPGVIIRHMLQTFTPGIFITARVDEENIRETYPWDYKILTARLSKRYSDFKCSNVYHQQCRELEKDAKFANERVLDPGNPRSAKKIFLAPTS